MQYLYLLKFLVNVWNSDEYKSVVAGSKIVYLRLCFWGFGGNMKVQRKSAYL